MPVVSMPRELRTASCSGGKTSPTTRTLVKKLAARAKWVAAPPSTRSRLPLGVSRVSKATEPTTRMDMSLQVVRCDVGLRSSQCGDLSTALRFGRDDGRLGAAFGRDDKLFGGVRAAKVELPVFAVEKVELGFGGGGDGGAVGHDGELC